MARAVAARPHFAPTDKDRYAAAQICKQLDGLPLALELAAAQVRIFSPEQIAARLDDRFRLLTGGSRTALPRQQTLRAALDWSYDLLSEPERVLSPAGGLHRWVGRRRGGRDHGGSQRTTSERRSTSCFVGRHPAGTCACAARAAG